MKDIFDRPLSILDIVACRRTGSRDLVIGQIVSFGKKQVTVAYKYRNIPRTVYHYPHDVCKAEGSVTDLKLDDLITEYENKIKSFDTSKYWTDAEYERAESRRDTLQEVVDELKKIKTATNPP